MSSFDVIAVGNATLDNFLWIKDTNRHFRLNKETKELSIKMGDKALIDKAYFLVGGNAANVSVGLTRLGIKTAIVAEIGEDEFAQKIINTLANEGVSENFLKKTSNATSFSIILNFKGDRTILEEKVGKEHNFSFEEIQTKWIYLTSIGDNWEKAYGKVLSYVKSNNIHLAFNPGSAQLDAGEEKIRDILKQTEILFVNKEEAAIITGIENTEDKNYEEYIKKLLVALREKGPRKAVITNGKKGAYVIDGQENFFYAKPSEAVSYERTGAGDSFASGFFGAVLYGKDYETAIKWGSLNASSVIGRVGSQPGLLRKEEIEQQIK